jgi:hypothetical protein
MSDLNVNLDLLQSKIETFYDRILNNLEEPYPVERAEVELAEILADLDKVESSFSSLSGFYDLGSDDLSQFDLEDLRSQSEQNLKELDEKKKTIHQAITCTLKEAMDTRTNS